MRPIRSNRIRQETEQDDRAAADGESGMFPCGALMPAGQELPVWKNRLVMRSLFCPPR